MLGALLGAIRILIAAVVVFVAPLCMMLLSIAAALLVLTALVFRFGAPTVDFPFWGMLSLALLCATARLIIQRLTGRLVQ
jgi:hypothetical protein